MTREGRENNKIIQERESAMMSRSRKMISSMTLVLSLFVSCIGFCAAPQEDKGVVNAILEAIRQPRPGEFSKPEDVVLHFLQCVRDREFDEALKAFPIRQRYEKITFEAWIEATSVFSVSTSPIPKAGFHNLGLAMQYANLYQRMSCELLGFDMARMMTAGTNNEGDAPSLDEIKERLDESKLRNLTVGEIRVTDRLRGEKLSGLHKTLGVEELCLVDASVKMPGQETTTAGLMVGKIRANWQVLGLN
jgi:hypothetical protein